MKKKKERKKETETERSERKKKDTKPNSGQVELRNKRDRNCSNAFETVTTICKCNAHKHLKVTSIVKRMGLLFLNSDSPKKESTPK